LSSSTDSTPDKNAATVSSLAERIIATGFFAGYVPGIPGTAGSLVGILLYLIPGCENPVVLIPIILLAFHVGVYCSEKVARDFGERMTPAASFVKSQIHGDRNLPHDPSVIVIDEIVGMLIALAFLPKTVTMVVLGFVLFRLFDIVKPFPVRNFERLPRGWGIMLDDVAAGVYANVVCRIVLLWF